MATELLFDGDYTALVSALEYALCQAKANNGYSLWFDGVDRNEGYVVGNGKLGLKLDSLRPIEPAYLAHTAQHFYNNVKSHGIGFWYHEGFLYVDPIYHYMAIQSAKLDAIAHGEIAIYDLKNGVEIKL